MLPKRITLFKTQVGAFSFTRLKTAAPPIHFPPSFLNPLCSQLVNSGCQYSLSAIMEPVGAPAENSSAFTIREKIELNSKEEAIFRTLLSTLHHFGLKTQLRVAGGWVRDKLLGSESHDIDIALDDCMGESFAEKVNQFLASENVDTHSVGVIKSNPDQSKHLETATMRIHGQWIDFVNLRAESYAEDSRIPSMMFGTPEQDALRRDLTINSLFYNINEENVEDFTGKGIMDLKEGIIRTPLPPVQTFLDDPLRVLRSVRFGARFGFQIDSDLKQAAMEPEVRAALASKVSRERVGKEVELMLTGKDPAMAMQYLAEFQLFPTIFALPPNLDTPVALEYPRQCVASLWEAKRLLGTFPAATIPLSENDEMVSLLLGALLLPLRDSYFTDKKKKKVSVSTHIVRESLKLKGSYADAVLTLHYGASQLKSLLEDDLDPPSESSHSSQNSLRVQIGLLLRKLKGQWKSALLLSCVLEKEVVQSDEDGPLPSKRNKKALSAEKSVSFISLVEAMGLEKVWELKPLLDGRSVIKALELTGKGPEIGFWVDKALEWQLANPKGTSDDCISWLKEEKRKRG